MSGPFKMNGWSGYQNSAVKHRIGKHPSKKDGHTKADHEKIKQDKKDARKKRRYMRRNDYRSVRPLSYDMD